MMVGQALNTPKAVCHERIFLFEKKTDEFNLLSFSEPLYLVQEDMGQVEVCIESIIPVITDATAVVVAVPQTATGMWLDLYIVS